MQEKFFIKDSIGIDEVGKGALAGPVVACAVLFHSEIKEDLLIGIGINDSKVLTARKRCCINEILMDLANEGLLHYGIGIMNSSYIDDFGIFGHCGCPFPDGLGPSPGPHAKEPLVQANWSGVLTGRLWD